MGELGVAIILALVVLAVVLFSVAVGQARTISKYERELIENAKKGKKNVSK